MKKEKKDELIENAFFGDFTWDKDLVEKNDTIFEKKPLNKWIILLIFIWLILIFFWVLYAQPVTKVSFENNKVFIEPNNNTELNIDSNEQEKEIIYSK